MPDIDMHIIEKCLTLQSAGALCAIVAILLYSNTLDCTLCFDDTKAIRENPDLRENVSWMNLLRNDFWGTPVSSAKSHKSYRPLCTATFKLNYLLHNLQPMGYHLVNVLLHSGVCYLFVQLCGVVFSAAVWPALISGLLFTVHPIHTEAVAGLVGRADLLSTLLFLAAFFSYRKSIVCGELLMLQGWMWLLLTLFFSVCSALSKETGITVMAVCAAYEFFIFHEMDLHSSMKLINKTLKRGTWNGPTWLKGFLIHSLVLGVFTAAFLWIRVGMNQTTAYLSVNNNPAMAFKTPYRQLHWLYLIFVNIWLLLNPSHLCAEYAMLTIPGISSFTDPRNLLTLATFAVLISLGIYSIAGRGKHHKIILFSFLLMVFPFLPASNLFFPTGFVIAERVLYLPSMGFCILAGWGVWHTLNRMKPRFLIKVSVIYLLLIHAAKVATRNRDWYSNSTLYHSSLRESTCANNAKMIKNLASVYVFTQNYSIAEALYQHAIDISPGYMHVYMDLGNLLQQQKKYAEAGKAYRNVAPLVSKILAEGNQYEIASLRLNETACLGIARYFIRRTGDLTEAYKFANLALEMFPTSDEAYTTKGYILHKMNRTSEARKELEEAVRLNPNSARSQTFLGDVYSALGNVTGAQVHFRNALHLNSSDNVTKLKLAFANIKTGREEDFIGAEQLLVEVLAADPLNDNALLCMGLVHYGLKRLPKAKELLERAVEVNPHHESALYYLALLYEEERNCSGAVKHFIKLLELEPNHLPTAIKLGNCYLNMKEREKGKEIFEEVLRRDPTNQVALNNLGVIMVEMEHKEKAIELFSQLAALDPENKPAMQQLQQLQK